MTRVPHSGWLYVAIMLVVVSFVLYVARDELTFRSTTPHTGFANFGSGAIEVAILMGSFGLGALGVILLVGRFLLERSPFIWVFFLGSGGVLVAIALASFNWGTPLAATSSDQMQTIAIAVEMIGFASIIAALSLFVVQWFARRSKRKETGKEE